MMMKTKTKNDHLIPVIIHNLVDRLDKIDSRTNEYGSTVSVLIAIRDFIDFQLKKRNIRG
jgi:hypothetical protein